MMNTRIKELEQQCWSHRVDGKLVDGQLHFDTQKFAELIVRDCALIAGLMEHEGRKNIGANILDSFGI
jgi:hypothetical protein